MTDEDGSSHREWPSIEGNDVDSEHDFLGESLLIGQVLKDGIVLLGQGEAEAGVERAKAGEALESGWRQGHHAAGAEDECLGGRVQRQEVQLRPPVLARRGAWDNAGRVRVTPASGVLVPGKGSLELSLAGIESAPSLAGELPVADGVDSMHLGACQADGRQGPEGTCLRRLEISRGRVLEWWESREEGLIQGFDVEEDTSPDEGPLVVSLRLGGGEVRDVSGDGGTARLRAAGGGGLPLP